jgi:oligopeptidase A
MRHLEHESAPVQMGAADSASVNPLLNALGLPDFARIQARHVVPAIEQLLAQARAALDHVVGDEVPADYARMSAVLDVAVERLGRAWGTVSHLNEVLDTPAMRAAFNASLPKVIDFYSRLGADERLFCKTRLVAESPEARQFSPARKQALTHALRDFVLGGAQLQGAARERFGQIQERLAELSQTYAEHVLDATDHFAYFASDEQMAGVPLDLARTARSAALSMGRSGYKLTLQAPCFYPVMRSAQDRALRQALYTAHITLASELGEPKFDNSALMVEILQLRQEQAQLLGLAHFAELSLVPKMATSTAEVHAFLDDLSQRARPFAQNEIAELREFAARELQLPDLQPWDIAYAAERLKQSRYAFGTDEVRQYFSLERVLDGLFDIAQQLFDLTIEAEAAPVWHDSVRHYRLRRGTAAIGSFYVDLHAREGKRSGAWMDDAQCRWARPDGCGLQLPVAYLVCDFASPEHANGASRPALLSHDDVITLFHEFGHGLHHLLTQVDELAVAGISGVEWDAVELPSQFMENFCWEWQMLARLSAHVDTGEPLPRALFDKMLAAKNFHSGLAMLRHMELAKFDMRIHAEPAAAQRLQHVADEVREQLTLLPTVGYNRFQHSFSHIFDGGYAAGYYSYCWAEVLSADAWSAFEEAGIFDAETGQRFRRNILEMGGSRSALDNFKAFRGREPCIDALLRHQGMA